MPTPFSFVALRTGLTEVAQTVQKVGCFFISDTDKGEYFILCSAAQADRKITNGVKNNPVWFFFGAKTRQLFLFFEQTSFPLFPVVITLCRCLFWKALYSLNHSLIQLWLWMRKEPKALNEWLNEEMSALSSYEKWEVGRVLAVKVSGFSFGFVLWTEGLTVNAGEVFQSLIADERRHCFHTQVNIWCL